MASRYHHIITAIVGKMTTVLGKPATRERVTPVPGENGAAINITVGDEVSGDDMNGIVARTLETSLEIVQRGENAAVALDNLAIAAHAAMLDGSRLGGIDCKIRLLNRSSETADADNLAALQILRYAITYRQKANTLE